MPRAPNASRTAAGVPAGWCMRIFKDHDAEGVWSWFAALSSQSMARRSVLSLWHKYRRRTRQLFGDAEMRRRIMGIKNSEYVALSKCTVQSIVDGWRAEDAKARKAAKAAKAAKARAASEPPLGASDLAGDPAGDPASDPEFYGPEDAASNSSKHTFRLSQLQELLEKCRADGVVQFEDAGPLVDKCALGWNKLSVLNPLELNTRAKAMVLANADGVWQSNNHTISNITWPVYETLRQVGLKPYLRGPAASDPGLHDLLYYLQWLGNDRSSEVARLALEAAGGV